MGFDPKRLADDLRNGTYAPRIRNDFRAGIRSGVNRSPTFFINGERYDGYWEDDYEFIGVLREAAGNARVIAGPVKDRKHGD
jgi:protein-disulfide isomerase